MVRDQLRAVGSRLFLDAASAILPALRNAAAHEDFIWDDETQQVRIDQTLVGIDEMNLASARAYDFMIGSELGIASAQYKSEFLFAALRQDDPKDGYRAFREQRALAAFGTNGAVVQKWSHDAGTFSVTISPVLATQFSPIFQALMWAAISLPKTRQFVVRISDRDAPVVDIAREPLELVVQAWMLSRQWFSSMIPSVFLPANAAARLQVEPVEICLRSIAWLAINDILHAIYERDDLLELRQQSTAHIDRQFVRSLQVIETSVRATMTMFDEAGPLPVREVLSILRDGLREMDKRLKDRSSRWFKAYNNKVGKLYDEWPAAAIVPTLDTRTLTEIE